MIRIDWTVVMGVVFLLVFLAVGAKLAGII